MIIILQQVQRDTHAETFTVTYDPPGAATPETITFPDGHTMNLRVPCESMTIARTGTYTGATITPDTPETLVLLDGSTPTVVQAPRPDADASAAACLVLWAIIFFKMLG